MSNILYNINIAVEIKPELVNVYFVYGCFSYYYQGVILSKAIEKLQSRANKNVLFLNSNQTKSNILNLWIIFKNIAREITYIIVRTKDHFSIDFLRLGFVQYLDFENLEVLYWFFYNFFIWKCWFFVFVWFLYSVDQGGDALTFFICIALLYSLETQSDSS